MKLNEHVILPDQDLQNFCTKWKISRLEIFGSALGNDFRQESDVDFLVSFLKEAKWSLLDMIRMESELEMITGRKVDLLTRHSVETSYNWIRRDHILNKIKTIYVA